MKRPPTTWIKFAALALLTSIGSALPPASATAQDQPVAPGGQEQTPLSANAALHYWRVWDTAGLQTEEFRSFNTMAGEYKSSDASWIPDEELAKALTGRQGFIEGLIKASRLEGCDWGVAYEEGVAALLPHLGHLRMSARLLGADARRELVTGKGDEAAHRIAAMLRMAQHARPDRIMISSLVSIAMVQTAADEAQVLAASGKLTDAGRAEIQAALARFEGADPFQMKAALDTERRVMLGWIRNAATGPEAGKKVISTFVEFDEAWKDSPLQTMDEAGVRRAVDVTSGVYLEMLAGWDEADAIDRLNAILARLEKGEYGELAKLVVPSITKAYEKNVKGKARIAATIGLMKGTVPAQPEAPAPGK